MAVKIKLPFVKQTKEGDEHVVGIDENARAAEIKQYLEGGDPVQKTESQEGKPILGGLIKIHPGQRR